MDDDAMLKLDTAIAAAFKGMSSKNAKKLKKEKSIQLKNFRMRYVNSDPYKKMKDAACVVLTVSWDVVSRHHNLFDLRGQSRENQSGLHMIIFPRRQLCDHLFGHEIYANSAITAQIWDYLVDLRDLTVHKDHLPHHSMT